MALFDGVDAMLDALCANGMVLAVVSSDSENNARAALGDCARHVSHFECGASLFGKAAKYKKVLGRAGIPADQAIAIGDEVRDGEAAQKAGIAFGAVSWGFASMEALQKLDPDFVFARVDEIPLKLSRVGKPAAP
jgi:phosphoglycolate phosphatase